jgi:dipeptidyl aminopeptidase/acylaminoacyl peptidase
MPTEASAPARRSPRHDFAQFTAIRRYQPALSFSPDGTQLAYSTNTSGQFNLWRQPSAGGYPRQLTVFTDEAVREIAWSPDGETILFTADRQGDEYTQLYLIPARGGRPEALTGSPGVQFHLAGQPWSPDGRTIAYAGNDRVPSDQDVIVRDVAGSETGRPLAGDGYYHPIAWSPDGRFLTAIQAKGNTDQDVHLVSLADGSSRNLLPHDGEIKLFPGPWAPDGLGFYLLTDEGREFLGLALYEIEAGSYRWIETPDWDIEDLSASDDGALLAWVVNEDGYSRLHLRDTRSGRSLPTPDLPDGVIDSLTVSRDGSKVAFLLNRPTHPSEIFVLDVASGGLTQLTDGFLGGIPDEDLIRPELIRFTTWDGLRIPAFLYRPVGASAANPSPVVLSIHGGPESQERPTYAYTGLYQYLLSRGIGVLAPNIRGSTGYGKTYQRLIHRDWSGGDRQDFEAAVKFLHGLDWVDPQRIAVFGGSYGGFATLTCVSRLPDYWAAAVDIVGPANLVTFTKAVPPTWRRFVDEWVGNPDTEADFLLERSPITYVDQIKTPLFVIQGARDPRVVQAESDQIVAKLRERGVPVRYDVYEDEGHGFTKRENELKALGDIAGFLEEHLLPA